MNGSELLVGDGVTLLGEHPDRGLGEERLGQDEHAIHVEDHAAETTHSRRRLLSRSLSQNGVGGCQDYLPVAGAEDGDGHASLAGAGS